MTGHGRYSSNDRVPVKQAQGPEFKFGQCQKIEKLDCKSFLKLCKYKNKKVLVHVHLPPNSTIKESNYRPRCCGRQQQKAFPPNRFCPHCSSKHQQRSSSVDTHHMHIHTLLSASRSCPWGSRTRGGSAGTWPGRGAGAWCVPRCLHWCFLGVPGENGKRGQWTCRRSHSHGHLSSPQCVHCPRHHSQNCMVTASAWQ